VCRGVLGEVSWPSVEGLRVDTWIASGTNITSNYDSLLAKVMVHDESRGGAIAKMRDALDGMRVKGIATNAQVMQAILSSEGFKSGAYDTNLIASVKLEPSFVEVRELALLLLMSLSSGCEPARIREQGGALVQ
jgi:urea carboxylase